MALIREIVGFARDDTFVSIRAFLEEKISDLRPLIDYGDDYELYAGSYEVSDAYRDRVATILGVTLQPDIDYFIEASQST